jgi:hypothetical protein
MKYKYFVGAIFLGIGFTAPIWGALYIQTLGRLVNRYVEGENGIRRKIFRKFANFFFVIAINI